MSNNSFMSPYAPHFLNFINYKRSLGYKYESAVGALRTFDRHLAEESEISIGLSKEIVEKWCKPHPNESESNRYSRMCCICQFIVYLNDIGLPSYIPRLPKLRSSDFISHIYTYEQMTELFLACDNLRLKHMDMRSPLFVMPCLIRMLYATGIRIGEAISLKNKDVNMEERYLTLREPKNGKDRIIPFTGSLGTVCADYLKHRNSLPIIDIENSNKPFFVSLNGDGCIYRRIYYWFQIALDRAGIQITADNDGPRIHSIRHTFACHSFVKQADDGVDLYTSWPYLSTYLGHTSLESTEKYIRLTAQLYPDLIKNGDRLYVDILPDLNNNNNNHKNNI